MSPRRLISTVESHTEGMATRVVTGGVAALPGATMEDRRQYLLASMDGLRTMLMFEPRGHGAMSGAILQPPLHPDADWGVLFIETTGCLPMCGHGTMGVATVLVETGMVPVREPVTTIVLDVPAGLVSVDVHVRDGHARQVTLLNVPSFAYALDQEVSLPDRGAITLDLAFGGNFYAIVRGSSLGVSVDKSHVPELIGAGLRVMEAVNEQCEPVHPLLSGVRGCHHVNVLAEDATARRSPHAMVIHPGWIDRSPCGTGTSARMAQLQARGELGPETDFLSVSLIGSQFVGRFSELTTVAGRPAIVPTITGRAWVTGTAQWVVDPEDPFAEGFLL